MNKIIKKALMAIAVASAIGLGAFGFAACGNDKTPPKDDEVITNPGDDDNNKPDDTTPDTPTVKEEFKFTGSTTVGSNTYNVSLVGLEDGTLEIDTGVQGAAKVGGYYFYTENKGYAFVLTDNAGTALTTTYNTTAKQHEVDYHLALGDDGEADVTLALKDADFELVSGKDTFYANAEFKGKSNEIFGIVSDMTLSFGENNTCTLSAAHNVFAGFCDTTGTYKFENNVFTVTLDEKGEVAASTFDPVSGTYTMEYSLSANGQNVTSTLTYTPDRTVSQQAAALKGVTSDGTNITAFFLSTGQVRIDQVGANGSIISESADEYNADLDNTGKYYFLNGQYIIVMEHGVFTSTYNAETADYTVEYTFASGDKVTLKGDALSYLVLEDLQSVGSFGDVRVQLYFVDEEKCVLDVSIKLASMASMLDKNGTYVVNNDGSITVTIADVDYEITYDDETESFSMDKYTIRGQDASADMILTGALWAD